MFSRFILFSLATAILAFATPMTEEEKALNDFLTAGMSENGINAMVNLENKFKAEFPLVAGNQESTDKFLVAFAAHTQDVVNTLSKEDQAIYNKHKDEIGLE
ncbi:hypothetical protein CAEBREN_09835 [Caenorhabditis brenneri]|uniref:SXP/RAL-2 family protein Ani s 5-like cation-binding domain-containing protein n=1 Tax=Caenorhabditis brenneri TaxID=135651 RepID=G0NMC6_CAEBE|nr:hypothetical protein CAEBREN_09835 [Caenorhabditis brenneri]